MGSRKGRAAGHERRRNVCSQLLVGLALAAVVAASPAGASSRQPTQPAQPAEPAQPAPVAMVGDSITYLSQGAIEAALFGRYDLFLSAVSGATMAGQYPAISWIEHSPQGRAANWVVELGTDDVGWIEDKFRTDHHWQREFTREVSALSNARCVILVTVSTYRKALPGPVPRRLDQMMEGEASSHSNFHVLDWGRIEYRKPAWVGSDHVHPTAAGADELASLVLKALDSDCPGAPAARPA